MEKITKMLKGKRVSLGVAKTRCKKFLLVPLLIFALFSFARTFAAEGINKQISFYGVLKYSTGAVVPDGNYDAVFKIYNATTGGAAIWTGNHTAANGNPVEVKTGNFATLLGSGTGNSLSNVDFTQDEYYVGVTVGSDTEMSPRQRIGAAAYSYNSDAVDGSSVFKVTASPEGMQVGSVGDIALDTAYNKLYIKSTGTSTNTGWAEVGATAVIADGSVTTAKLADGAVTSDKILDGTIITTDLADGSITTIKISDGSVTEVKIADGAVTTAKLADSSVTSAKIVDGTVTTQDLADNSITTSKVTDLNITTDKIADSAITTIKLADGSVTSAKITDDSIVDADVNASANIALSKLAGGANIVTSLAAPSGSNANGGSIANNVLTLSLADGTNPGLVSATAQTFAGAKTFNDSLTVNSVSVAQGAWTTRSSMNLWWQSVIYAGGQFVAIAQNNAAMTSPDGVNWTQRVFTNPELYQSLAYGNGTYVAVGHNLSGAGRVLTSPDGVIWTERTAAADNQWQSVTYANGLFVAVSNTGTGNRVMTSPDGIIWTSRTSAADNNWMSVTYGNGFFVAVAASGTDRAMISTDGINWTTQSMGTDSGVYNAVAYDNGTFVAVGDSGAVATSLNGVAWTVRTAAVANNWQGVAYGNGFFVAVSKNGSGNRVMISSDNGATWTTQSSAADSSWMSIVAGNNMFVAVAEQGASSAQYVMTSSAPTVGTAIAANGGIVINSGSPSVLTNALYNLGGALYWNGSTIDSSQWTVNGDDIYYATGNVGIGTATPDNALSVNGGITLASTTPSVTTNAIYNQSGTLYFNGSAVGGGSAAFVNNGNAFGALTTLGTTDNNALQFITNNTEAMRILADGKVGIGTNAATAKLAVVESTGSTTPFLVAGQSSSQLISGYSYRAPIAINASSALTDYETRVVIDTSALVTAGKMQSDGDDIRFTSSDGTTIIPHYVEKGMNTSSTVIWVQADLTSGSNTLYMYYGNSSETTNASNGNNVFTFFDDFTGSSINSGKWTTTTNTGLSVSGGNLNMTNNTDDIRSTWSYSGTQIIQETQFATISSLTDNFNAITFGSLWAADNPSDDYVAVGVYRVGGFDFGIYHDDDFSPATLTSILSTGTEYLTSISVISGTQATVAMSNYSTGLSLGSATVDNVVSNGELIRLPRRLFGSGTSGNFQARFVRVRQYAATEPTATIGNEESGSATSQSTFLTVNSSGNVGIGTSNPGSLLHIAGLTTVGGSILPGADDTYDLGSATMRFRDLYLGSASLHIGDKTLSNSNGSLVWSGTSIEAMANATSSTELKLSELSGNGTNYTGFKAPDGLAANVLYTLPSADGTSGQVLSTNGGGALSWASAGGESVGKTSTLHHATGTLAIIPTHNNSEIHAEGTGGFTIDGTVFTADTFGATIISTDASSAVTLTPSNFAGSFLRDGTVDAGFTALSIEPDTAYRLTVTNNGGSKYLNVVKVGGSSGGSSQWTTSGSDVYRDTGRVAIGTSTFTATQTNPGLVSGTGVVSTVGTDTLVTYNTTGTTSFTPPTGVTTVRVLVVGGAGGGGGSESVAAGDGGGGGGAGEFIDQSSFNVSSGAPFTVTVGTGGTGQAGGQGNIGTGGGSNGNNSVFSTLTARGGGGGGANDAIGLNGGSGGGAGGECSITGSTIAGGSSTAVSPGVGNAGGSDTGAECTGRGGSGGGGAGVSGVGANNTGTTAGTAGGAGRQSDINGSNLFYAAGGGGGAGSSGTTGGSGGSSIGGTGGVTNGSATSGSVNRGAGGGGGGAGSSGTGGNGGSGVVIVRFATVTLGNIPLEVVRSTDGKVARFTDTNGSCDIDPTSTALVCTSDATLKKNVVTVDSTLDKMLALNPVEFNWQKEDDDSAKHLGLIAQEVEEIFPSLVSTNENGLKAIAYDNLTPLIIKAIQELNDKVDGKPKTLAQMEEDILDLEIKDLGLKVGMLLDFEEDGSLAFNWKDGITFKSRLTFEDEDMAGYAEIAKGADETKVDFKNEYKFTPIVQITPLGGYNARYWVDEEGTSAKGFKIKIDSALDKNARFSWTALAVKRPSDNGESANDDSASELTTADSDGDTVSPMITLKGDAEATIKVGETYTDPGATAEDNIDGDITALIVTKITDSTGAAVESIDTAVAGEYTVTYTVEDEAGNSASEERKVIVESNSN